jgi:2-iminobutanoate/2-iminopropanoate deaminase
LEGKDEKNVSLSFPVTPILLKSLFYKTGMCLFNVGKSIMEQKQITTPHAPAAIGPYSQAIRYGQFIYTSGQIPLDPGTGEIVGDDVQTQTHRVLQNLQAVLESAGASLKSVIKTTVFLTQMSDFQAMNTVYAGYFTGTAPARSTVAVAELPRKALVEIECIALVAD